MDEKAFTHTQRKALTEAEFAIPTNLPVDFTTTTPSLPRAAPYGNDAVVALTCANLTKSIDPGGFVDAFKALTSGSASIDAAKQLEGKIWGKLFADKEPKEALFGLKPALKLVGFEILGRYLYLALCDNDLDTLTLPATRKKGSTNHLAKGQTFTSLEDLDFTELIEQYPVTLCDGNRVQIDAFPEGTQTLTPTTRLNQDTSLFLSTSSNTETTAQPLGTNKPALAGGSEEVRSEALGATFIPPRVPVVRSPKGASAAISTRTSRGSIDADASVQDIVDHYSNSTPAKFPRSIKEEPVDATGWVARTGKEAIEQVHRTTGVAPPRFGSQQDVLDRPPSRGLSAGQAEQDAARSTNTRWHSRLIQVELWHPLAFFVGEGIVLAGENLYRSLARILHREGGDIGPAEFTHLLKAHQRQDIPCPDRRIELSIFRRWGAGWRCPVQYVSDEAAITAQCERIALNERGQLYTVNRLANLHGDINRFGDIINHLCCIFTYGRFDSALAILKIGSASTYAPVIYWAIGLAVRDKVEPLDFEFVETTARLNRRNVEDAAVEGNYLISPDRFDESTAARISAIIAGSELVDLADDDNSQGVLFAQFDTFDRSKDLIKCPPKLINLPDSPSALTTTEMGKTKFVYEPEKGLKADGSGVLTEYKFFAPPKHTGRTAPMLRGDGFAYHTAYDHTRPTGRKLPSLAHRAKPDGVVTGGFYLYNCLHSPFSKTNLPPLGVKLTDKDLCEILRLVHVTKAIPKESAAKWWPADIGTNAVPITQRISAGPPAIECDPDDDYKPKYVEFKGCFAFIGGGHSARLLSNSEYSKQYWYEGHLEPPGTATLHENQWPGRGANQISISGTKRRDDPLFGYVEDIPVDFALIEYESDIDVDRWSKSADQYFQAAKDNWGAVQGVRPKDDISIYGADFAKDCHRFWCFPDKESASEHVADPGYKRHTAASLPLTEWLPAPGPNTVPLASNDYLELSDGAEDSELVDAKLTTRNAGKSKHMSKLHHAGRLASLQLGTAGFSLAEVAGLAFAATAEKVEQEDIKNEMQVYGAGLLRGAGLMKKTALHCVKKLDQSAYVAGIDLSRLPEIHGINVKVLQPITDISPVELTKHFAKQRFPPKATGAKTAMVKDVIEKLLTLEDPEVDPKTMKKIEAIQAILDGGFVQISCTTSSDPRTKYPNPFQPPVEIDDDDDLIRPKSSKGNGKFNIFQTPVKGPALKAATSKGSASASPAPLAMPNFVMRSPSRPAGPVISTPPKRSGPVVSTPAKRRGSGLSSGKAAKRTRTAEDEESDDSEL
nr:hypothetical protein B0A51_11254 [Rachicladosporium sp. CCFEE 5018]